MEHCFLFNPDAIRDFPFWSLQLSPIGVRYPEVDSIFVGTLATASSWNLLIYRNWEDQDAGDQDSDTLREELQRSREELPPHDSEDSLGPEYVADELRRLTTAHTQMTGSVSTHEPREEPQLQMQLGKITAHMHLRGQEEIVDNQCPLTHSCFIQLFGWSMIKSVSVILIKRAKNIPGWSRNQQSG